MKVTNIEAIKRGPKYWKKWVKLTKISGILKAEHSNDYLDFSNSNLKGLNLYDIDARDGNSYYIINLQGANFENCDLSDAKLELLDLSNVNFKNANLRNTSFRKSNYNNAIFKNCDLQRANFHKSIIDNCDFSFSDLSKSDFSISSGDNINLLNSKIKNIEITPFMPSFNSIMGISSFELALAKNLDKVHPESQEFVLNYIAEAFLNIHKSYVNAFEVIKLADGSIIFEGERKYALPEKNNHKYFNKLINRIESLNNIFTENKLSSEVIKISNILSAELIKYLKSNPKHLYQIHWRVFEELIAEILKSFGWDVELTSPTKDGGYDIFGIYKDISGIKHSWLIECKKWDSQNFVGVDVVRALYGVKTDLKVGNALLATTSFFTKGVQDFKASRYDFETIDFNGIVNWLNVYKMNKSGNLWISDNKLIIK